MIPLFSKRQIRGFYWLLGFTTLIFIAIPLLFYVAYFRNQSISNHISDWGNFGSYIGGVIGAFFGLLATVLSLVSIYVSMRIAQQVQQDEQAFNTANATREQERFKKEIELLHAQNKPYLFFELLKSDEYTKIIIQNQGLGPLYIKTWSIIYNQKVYQNFYELLTENDFELVESALLNTNTSPIHIIAPNGSKLLLELRYSKVIDQKFTQCQNILRAILSNSNLSFEYTDIFENKYSDKKDLKFFS